jgi:hypothetical protein
LGENAEIVASAALANETRQKIIEKVLDEAGRANLRHLLGMVAHRRVRHADTAIEIADLREAIGPAFVAGIENDDESARILLSVVQFAFFGAGARSGTVDFTHPILAEHMAAGYALHLLRAAATRLIEARSQSAMTQLGIAKSAIRQALGSEKLVEGSVFCRALARGVATDTGISGLLEAALSLFGKEEKKISAAVQVLLSR